MPTWDGETNGNFLTGTNWSGDVAPAPGSAVVINDGGLANQPTLGTGDASTVDTVSVSAGSLTVDGNLSATTGVFITGGIVKVNGAGSIAGLVTNAGTGTLTVDGTSSGNFISSGGTSTFRMSGALGGTLTLSGGEVNFETFGSLLDATDLMVDGGTLRLNNAHLSVDSLSGSGGTIDMRSAAGNSELSFGSDGGSTSFSGVVSTQIGTTLVKEGVGNTTFSGGVSGGGAIAVNGGTLTLAAANSFSGIAEISAATLALSGDGSIANSSAVSMGGNGVFDISATTSGAAVNQVYLYAGQSGSINMGGRSLTIANQTDAMGGLTFIGGVGVDALSITLSAAVANFSLADVTFNSWTNGEDSITITGNGLANAITGNGFANTLSGGGGGDTLTGSVNDNVFGGNGDDTLVNFFVSGGVWDGGADNDTLDVSADNFDGFVFNLSAANFEIFGALFSNFENVIGSQGNDILIGSNTVNRLNGFSGDDLISGGVGADVIDGGAGTGDTADYRTSAAGQVSISLLADTASGGHAAGDTLDGIENLIGSLTLRDILIGDNSANRLEGFGGSDSLRGEAGDDYLDGGAGADALNGGAGVNDWAGYRTSTVGTVSINLLTAVYSGGDAQGDTLFFIENLEGSLTKRDILIGNIVANRLVGNGGVDSLLGGDGNDVLEGGTGGDSLNGGAGIDTASYQHSSEGVTIDLAVALQTSLGDAAGESLNFIENIDGSVFADSLIGNYQSNTLRGGFGTDILNGGAGSDYLTGGDDADTFRFSGLSFGADTITDWDDGVDLISIALPLETSFAGLTFSGNGTTSVIVRGFNGTGSAIIVKADLAFTLDAGDFVFV